MIDWYKLYALQAEGKHAAAMDIIYNAVDSLDVKPDIVNIDIILSQVDPSKLKSSLMIGFLGAAYSLSPMLKEYKLLLDRIETELRSIGRTEEDINKLLSGFKKPPTMRLVMK